MAFESILLPSTGDRVGRGVVCVTLAAAGFVMMDSMAKYFGPVIPVNQLLWGRYTFHFGILLALIPVFGHRLILYTRQPVYQLLRGVLMLTGTTTAYLAVQFLPLATTITIGFTAPLIVTILSIPLLGETVGIRRWVAVGTGFLGAVIAIRPGSGDLNIGVLFAFGMALSFALYQILTRRAAHVDGPLAGLFYAASLGAVLTSLVAPFNWTGIGLVGWGALVLLGVLGACSHLLLIIALHSAPASLVSPFIYTQIIWGVLIGVTVFRDFPDMWTFVGAGLIVGAGLFVFLRERAIARRTR